MEHRNGFFRIMAMLFLFVASLTAAQQVQSSAEFPGSVAELEESFRGLYFSQVIEAFQLRGLLSAGESHGQEKVLPASVTWHNAMESINSEIASTAPVLLVMEARPSELPSDFRVFAQQRFDGYIFRLYISRADIPLLAGAGEATPSFGDGGAEPGNNPENRRPVSEALRMDIYAELRSSRVPQRRLGGPLLLWPDRFASEYEVGDSEPRRQELLLVSLLYNRGGELLQLKSYTYDRQNNFVELQRYLPVSRQNQKANTQSFVLVREDNFQQREYRFDGAWNISSYRFYDAKGRLNYQSGESAGIEILYLEGGGKREIEAMRGGEVETRLYSEDNNITRSAIAYPDGRTEERRFAYDEDGRISREEYRGVLGSLTSTYSYEQGELAFTETQRDGMVVLQIEYDGKLRIETRFVRGAAVLRVTFRDNSRILEEELAGGQVVRRREYGELPEDQEIR